jgi:hypothetical protein
MVLRRYKGFSKKQSWTTKDMKFAHRPGIHTVLITLRNTLFRKSFKNVARQFEENIVTLGIKRLTTNANCLIELGVGYTITDSLIIRNIISPEKIYLYDVNRLLNIRTYCLFSLLNPLNYLERHFRNVTRILVAGLMGGEGGLRKHGIEYRVQRFDPCEGHSNALFYSNAVLEHMSKAEIKKILFQSNAAHLSVFGFIDANDHHFRHLPPEAQFKNYSNDLVEIQTRGNSLRLEDYDHILKKYFAAAEIGVLNKNIYGERIYFFCATN